MAGKKKIVVKVGTNVITKEDGLLDLQVVEHLVGQLATVQRMDIDIILVSSGAMGAGRALIQLKDETNVVVKRQVLASVGQIKLIETYLALFQKQNTLCSQVLVTKEDFRDRVHYLNMKNCFEALWANKVIPVVNENDVISVDELMFTDNDELAGLIASMLNADSLILLSNVEGIYDKNPEERDARVLHKVAGGASLQKFIAPTTSSFGRGGMLTKAKIAQRLAAMGIHTFIANGHRRNVLLDIMEGKEIGTEFLPEAKRPSNVKRWIADSEGREKGVVTINECGEKILREKIASLLPVGIIKVEGDFQKGDLVKIQNVGGAGIGYGIATYGADLARKCVGEKGKKALIHYDYLFLKK